MPQFLPYNTLAEGEEFRDADGNLIQTFNPDVQTTPPVDGNTLVYSTATGNWAPGSSASGGAIAAITVLFNAGTHTVPVPSEFGNVVGLRIRAAGGGASGGGGGQGNNVTRAVGGTGGEAGQFQERYIAVGTGATDLSPNTTELSVTIGTGGPAQAGRSGASNSLLAPAGGNPGVATTLTGPRGSDEASTTLQTFAGGAANKYPGVGFEIAVTAGTPVAQGGTGGSTAYGRGGAAGTGNVISADSSGGGGGGGAGWFDGSDGETEAAQGQPGGDGGAGGGGGMVIEWLTIQISQIG